MALVDMGEEADLDDGFWTIGVSCLPSAQALLLKVVPGVLAYYEGRSSPATLAVLRPFLVEAAQGMIARDPACIRPPDRPGDPPWVLIDHEALQLS